MNDTPEMRGPSAKLIRFALAASCLLAVASGGLFYFATTSNRGAVVGDVFKIEVGDKSCNPNSLEVPAGRRTFEIFNASSRPVEWEILDGIMVVEERENIAPGYRQTLSANLSPGKYRITCGLLSNAMGSMTVTATAESNASAQARPQLKAFIGPLSEYKVYLAMQASAFQRKAGELSDAIKSGNIEAARTAYLEARKPYKQIEPVASRLSDLQSRIDVVALYLEKHEQDPAFIGFHRIEYGLFGANKIDGLAQIADQLVADASALKARLREIKLAPELMSGGGAMLARRLAEGRIENGEDMYARTDLADFDANLTGIEKLASLLKPAMTGAASQAADEMDVKLKSVRQTLVDLRSGDTYPAYPSIEPAARRKLADAFTELANALDKASDALKLDLT